MNVADRIPASWPAVTSSSSTAKLLRSAQRRYIRSSISAQSWASVPPAPACTSQTASRVVVLAGEQAAQLEVVELDGRARRPPRPGRPRPRRAHPALRHRHLVERRGVLEPGGESAEQIHVGPEPAVGSVVTSRAWSGSDQRSGAPTSGSSCGQLGDELVDAQIGPRRLETDPQGGEALGEVARSVPGFWRGPPSSRAPSGSARAVAELELLAAPAPARLVAAELGVSPGRARRHVGRPADRARAAGPPSSPSPRSPAAAAPRRASTPPG